MVLSIFEPSYMRRVYHGRESRQREHRAGDQTTDTKEIFERRKDPDCAGGTAATNKLYESIEHLKNWKQKREYDNA
jgi:hypothetical protein